MRYRLYRLTIFVSKNLFSPFSKMSSNGQQIPFNLNRTPLMIQSFKIFFDKVLNSPLCFQSDSILSNDMNSIPSFVPKVYKPSPPDTYCFLLLTQLYSLCVCLFRFLFIIIDGFIRWCNIFIYGCRYQISSLIKSITKQNNKWKMFCCFFCQIK